MTLWLFHSPYPFNGNTVNNGSSVTAYQSSSVPFGNSCVSETRTCNNGTLSGSYTFSSCTVGAAANCTFNGNTVNNGSSVTAYQSSSVPFGNSCVSETRTCNNGTLSGSYTYSSCTPAVVPACNFTGWAWSDTIGWISLSGPGYGFRMDTSGNITGYAWSDNIGWVQAGGLSGFPSGPGTASSNATLSGTSIVGWLRALAGNAPPTNSQNGGWDGWISLGGTAPAYGVTRDPSTGNLSGFAWGDMNVGWVDFSYGKCSGTCTPSAEYSCSGQTIVETDTDASCNITTKNLATCVQPAYFCSAGSSTCLPTPPTFTPTGPLTGHLQVFPQLVHTGDTAQVYWNVDNVTNCRVTSTNGNTWPGPASGRFTAGPTGQQSNPIDQQTVFTLSCTELDGSSVKETATVNVVPVFQEI